MATVRAEDSGSHLPRVPHPAVNLLACVHVPDSQCEVGCREGAPVIRRKQYLVDQVRVSLETAQFLAARYVPESDRLVPTARQNPAAVGRKADGVNPAGVPFE